jgi:pyruvate dehydrogenase E1 component
VERTLQSLAEDGVVDRSLAAQAIEKYRLHDVNAGTSGNAGGES